MSKYLAINNLDLNSITNLEIDRIRTDTVPERRINVQQLAWEDGSLVPESRYGEKTILVYGHLTSGTYEQYEIDRDSLMYMIHTSTEAELVIEQSGAFRRYYGLYENIAFDYQGNGFALVNIVLRVTKPFGEDTTYTTAVDTTGVTNLYTATFDTGGTIYAQGRIHVKINSISPLDSAITYTFTTQNSGQTYETKVSAVFEANDTITIDAKTKDVYINDSRVAYTGQLPVFYKGTSIEVKDTATARNIDLLIQYYKRYI